MKKVRDLLRSLSVTLIAAIFSNELHAETPTEFAVYAAGDIAMCNGDPRDSAAFKTAALIPADATVITLGDSVYPLATPKNLDTCFSQTWGRFLDRTFAVPGNHDYVGGKLTEFSDFFGAHTDPNGYFARRIGSWLFIGLNSNQSGAKLAAQFEWLARTLDEQKGDVKCIVAFWHHALVSSGLHSGDGDRMRPAWQMLYEHHADIVMSGHEHFYERFGQLNSKGAPDERGIREFVVGTGGATLYGIYRPSTRSSFRRAEHGVLGLKLSDGGYTWEFETVRREVIDRGHEECHAKNVVDR